MERIRFAALKGDSDLAMPIICSAPDTLGIKEVREAEPASRDAIAVSWEFYTGIAAAAAGAEIICVRHPETIGRLREAFTSMKKPAGPAGVQ
jgi:acetyl-CoA decarbonylase/synthase complex subunit delta